MIVFQRVLTAEYMDACKVDDVEDLRRRGLDVADVSLQYYIYLVTNYRLKKFEKNIAKAQGRFNGLWRRKVNPVHLNSWALRVQFVPIPRTFAWKLINLEFENFIVSFVIDR